MPNVFISYVKENTETVKKLAQQLRHSGINVWVDRDSIQPGVRWKDAIRKAINQGDYFIACFSSEYYKREQSYMNEELTLAIEELRKRSSKGRWFIPVILSKNCSIPDRRIGGGETLRDIQWVDLSHDWHKGIQDIIALIKDGPDSDSSMHDIMPWLKQISDHLERVSSKAMKGNKVWKEYIGADLFALPIRIRPARIKLTCIQDYAGIGDRKIALIGKPGSGKTTAVTRIFAKSLGQYGLIPIKLQREWLLDPEKVADKVGKLLDVNSTDLLNVLDKSGRLLFIFDGLDQTEHMETNFATINQLSTETFEVSNFLVTCREEEYHALPETFDFDEQCIQNLNRDDINYFFSKMENADQIHDVINREDDLRKICSNKFIFLMVIQLLRENEIAPRLSSEVYDKFLDRFLNTWVKKRTVPDRVGVTQIREYLENTSSHIAVKSDRVDEVSRTSLEAIIPEDVLRSLLHNGFLESRGDQIAFFQHTFQEFLFASWLFRENVFPVEFKRDDQGRYHYKNAYISSRTLMFYKEITGFSNTH